MGKPGALPRVWRSETRRDDVLKTEWWSFSILAKTRCPWLSRSEDLEYATDNLLCIRWGGQKRMRGWLIARVGNY